MTESQAAERAASDAGRAWILGGALLLGTVVLAVGAQFAPLLGAGGSEIGRTLLVSASLLVFAFGIRGSGSVTARRPLGTAALVVLAVWMLLAAILDYILSFSSDTLIGALTVFDYVSAYVQFALALIAVVQVGRADAVPTPWNWAPSWVLAALAVPWLLNQIVAAGVAQNDTSVVVILILDSIIRVGSAIFLGVIAIVLGDRRARA